jgi:hypothetical protein
MVTPKIGNTIGRSISKLHYQTTEGNENSEIIGNSGKQQKH